MIDLLHLNKRLKEAYGLTIDGKNRFRVVWSESATEKRINPQGHVEELRKYSYIQRRYIFEAYIPSAKANNELHDPDGFEPIYIFQSKLGQALDPEWWACEFIVKNYLESTANAREHKKTDAMMRAEEAEKEAKEVEKIKDALDTSSVDQMKFRYGEAVIHDSTKALSGEES